MKARLQIKSRAAPLLDQVDQSFMNTVAPTETAKNPDRNAPRCDCSLNSTAIFGRGLLFLHALDIRSNCGQLAFNLLVSSIDVIDAVDPRGSPRTRPASTSAADARRSLAITLAP